MTSPATGPPATGTVPPRRAGTAAGPPESPGHVSSARPCRGPHAPPPPPAWPAPLLPPSSGPDRASCCPSPVAPRGVPVTLAAAPSLPSRPSPSHLPSRREPVNMQAHASAPPPSPGSSTSQRPAHVGISRHTPPAGLARGARARHRPPRVLAAQAQACRPRLLTRAPVPGGRGRPEPPLPWAAPAPQRDRARPPQRRPLALAPHVPGGTQRFRAQQAGHV